LKRIYDARKAVIGSIKLVGTAISNNNNHVTRCLSRILDTDAYELLDEFRINMF